MGCGSLGGTRCSADLNEVQHEATKRTKDARRRWSQAHVRSREGGPDVTAARHAHPATGDARWVTELGVGAGAVRRKRGVAGDSTSGGPEFGVIAGNNTELRTLEPHPRARRGIHSPQPTDPAPR